MSWDKKYIEYGVVKVKGDRVEVYKEKWNNNPIFVGKPVKSTSWKNGILEISLENGDVRHYTDFYNFKNI